MGMLAGCASRMGEVNRGHRAEVTGRADAHPIDESACEQPAGRDIVNSDDNIAVHPTPDLILSPSEAQR